MPHAPLASSTPASARTKPEHNKNRTAKPSALLASALEPAADPASSAAPKVRRPILCPEVAQAVYARLDWAALLKRTYLEDVLACPCGGRRRILADLTEPEVVTAILRQLDLPTEPPPIAQARAPSWFEPA